jgi:hypothetical protein
MEGKERDREGRSSSVRWPAVSRGLEVASGLPHRHELSSERNMLTKRYLAAFPGDSEGTTSESQERRFARKGTRSEFASVSRPKFHTHPNSRIDGPNSRFPNSEIKFIHPNRV